MSVIIEANSLSRSFGENLAVDNISFNVKKGEVLGFLGPNGAGKSTTMKMLTCFLTPSSGSAKICGYDILEDLEQVQQRIGYLPENAPLYGEMTVVDFLTFIASTRRIPASEIKNKIDVSIQRTSLENVINQKIETLSKGFKRRVGLAQAIVHDPEVLILDEPTDGLDPNQKHDVRNLIQSMSVDKSIIVSTHILEEVDAICTRALIISQGKVVADGTPVELKRKATGAGIVILDFTTVEMAEKARSILENVDSSAKVEIHDSSVKLHPKSSKIDVIRDSLKMLDGQDVQVLDLYSEEAQLDEVFRSVTSAHNS